MRRAAVIGACVAVLAACQAPQAPREAAPGRPDQHCLLVRLRIFACHLI